MSRGFNYDGPVMSGLSRVTDLILLDILYILCCLPIVTIGAATTALYYVTLKMAKNEEGYIVKSFLKSFISNLKQATAIWLIFVVVIGVIISDIAIVSRNMVGVEGLNNVVLVASGVIGILVLFTLEYVFPLLAQFDNTIKNTIKNAFLISIRHLPYTIAMAIIWAVPFILMYYSNSAIMLVFIMFSLIAFINSKFYNKIFVLYMPPSEEHNEDEHIFSDGEVNV